MISPKYLKRQLYMGSNFVCMQDTFARATHSAARPSARDDRVSCIQQFCSYCQINEKLSFHADRNLFSESSKLTIFDLYMHKLL